MTRIVLIDDHALVREGLKRLLEREVGHHIVGEAASQLDAMSLVAAEQPDLVITDISLANGSGMAVLRWLQNHPAIATMVVSMFDTPAFVAEAMSLGARAYVTKGAAPEELVEAVKAVVRGDRYFSKDIRRPQNGCGMATNETLTPRELQTLRLLVRGLVPKAAAAELGISEKTLYAHRANLLDKLGVRNERDLARIAVERGLV